MKTIQLGEKNNDHILATKVTNDLGESEYVHIKTAEIEFVDNVVRIEFDNPWFFVGSVRDHTDYLLRQAYAKAAASQAAAALGSITSERKATAARENGKKGGRPRKQSN